MAAHSVAPRTKNSQDRQYVVDYGFLWIIGLRINDNHFAATDATEFKYQFCAKAQQPILSNDNKAGDFSPAKQANDTFKPYFLVVHTRSKVGNDLGVGIAACGAFLFEA